MLSAVRKLANAKELADDKWLADDKELTKADAIEHPKPNVIHNSNGVIVISLQRINY